MQELVSFIIPVYNTEEYLERSITSVLNQTYTCLEVLLVDDGSTDSSGSICDYFAKKDKRVRVIHQKNQGMSAARNTGIEQSRGEYVVFLDSDDSFETDMLSSIIPLLKKYPDADFACFRSRKIYVDMQESISRNVSGSAEEKVFVARDVIKDYRVYLYQVWNKVFRHRLIDKVRFPLNQVYEEIDFVFQIIEHMNQGVFIDRVLHNYTVSREGNTNQRRFSEVQLKILPDLFIKRQSLLKTFDNDQGVMLIFDQFALELCLSIFKRAFLNQGSPYDKRMIKDKFRKYYRISKVSRMSAKAQIRFFTFYVSPKIFVMLDQYRRKNR